MHQKIKFTVLALFMIVFVGVSVIVLQDIQSKNNAEVYEPDVNAQTATFVEQSAVNNVASLDTPVSLSSDPCTMTVPSGASIQQALDVAAGSAADPYVVCVSGAHQESIHTTRDNLTIRGIADARITQGSDNKIITIKHDFVTVEGLIVDGLVNGQPADNKLIWMEKAHNTLIQFNTLTHGGGECVRLLSNSSNNEIRYNDILGCGVFKYGTTKNGEGIYIGLDPEALATSAGWQKYHVDYRVACQAGSEVCFDDTGSNRVHHNRIQTGFTDYPDKGNECVDIKEGSKNNRITFNTCTGQQDIDSGAFDTRSSLNEFSHNTVLATASVKGAALRIGAEPKNSAKADGSVITLYPWKAEGNDVIKNELLQYSYSAAVKVSNKLGGIKQGVSCGNTVKANGIFSSDATLISNPPCASADDDGLAPGIGDQCVGVRCKGVSAPVPTNTPTGIATMTPTVTPTSSPTPPVTIDPSIPTATPSMTVTPTITPTSQPTQTPVPTIGNTALKPPRNVKVTSPKDSEVILKWKTVNGADKYRVYMSKPDKKTIKYEKSTKKTTMTFNLKSCRTYYFAVSAVDKDGRESDLSSRVSVLVAIGDPIHPCK